MNFESISRVCAAIGRWVRRVGRSGQVRPGPRPSWAATSEAQKAVNQNQNQNYTNQHYINEAVRLWRESEREAVRGRLVASLMDRLHNG